MMSRVLFALVAVLACAASVQAYSCKSASSTLSAGYTLCYSYTASDLYIEASTTAVQTNGWVGFGFSLDGYMSSSSIIFGSPAYGVVNQDLGDHTIGSVGTTLATTMKNLTVVAGKTVISFNLPLVGGAYIANGNTYVAADGSSQIIYARGSALAAAGNPAQHATANRATQSFTFAMDPVTSASSTGAAAAASSTAAAAAVASSTANGPVTPSAASDSICDRYAFALNMNTPAGEFELMNMIVVRAIVGNVTANGVTVEGLANNVLTKPFFNGANPSYRSAAMNGAYGGGSTLPNFLVAGDAQSGLITSLNQFLGKALGCSVGNFTTAYSYGGLSNMTAVHSSMPITQTVFNAFNAQLGYSAASYGVSQSDLSSVGALLATFQRGAANSASSICNDVATCNCLSGLDGMPGSACTVKMAAASATAGVSVVSVLMAAVAAMIAMRQ